MNTTALKQGVQRPSSVELEVVEPASRKRTRDRSGKQRALLQAALHLFAAKGFEATSTREIAAAAGCAEGLIHRYFHGKAGLLPALVEHRMNEEMADLDRTLPPAPSLQEEFIQLVEWEVEFMWKNRQYLRIFIPRSIVQPPLKSNLNHVVLGVRVQTITDRLKRYPASAKLSSTELEGLAELVGILGLIFGFMRPVVLGQDRTTARATAICLARMMIGGVVGGAASPAL